MIKQRLCMVLSHILRLAQYHILLPLDRPLVQLLVLRNVREDLDHLWCRLVETVGLETGLFARGVCVELGSHVFDLVLHLVLGTGLGAFEHEVLYERQRGKADER